MGQVGSLTKWARGKKEGKVSVPVVERVGVPWYSFPGEVLPPGGEYPTANFLCMAPKELDNWAKSGRIVGKRGRKMELWKILVYVLLGAGVFAAGIALAVIVCRWKSR